MEEKKKPLNKVVDWDEEVGDDYVDPIEKHYTCPVYSSDSNLYNYRFY